jgi:hypothetical protein
MNVAVVPLTLHTLVVVEEKETVSPELAVAESVSGVPTVWEPGLAKVIVCAVRAAFTVMLRLAVADCGVGWVESVTVIFTEPVPTAPCAGVPVIEPVELFIERLLGRPMAL